MRKLIVFNSVSVDGYFVDGGGDMSWAHRDDPEWNAFVGQNAQGAGGELLFGRVTYELMAAYWPSPAALANDRAVAEGINRASKVVFSRTLDRASWTNTRLTKKPLEEEVRRLKKARGGDLVVLGSGSIVSQLAQAGLVDEYQLALNPIVLGEGRTLFEGLPQPLGLRLLKTRPFKNGNVLLRYAPA